MGQSGIANTHAAYIIYTAIAVNEVPYSFKHGLINYVDTEAKCRDLKKLTYKGALRQVFIRVYRLTVTLVFSTQLCELLPSPLLSGSTLPPPFPV